MKNYKGLISAILFIGIILFIYFNGERDFSKYKNQILEDPKIVNGVVTSIRSKYKHGYEVEYDFFYDNSSYSSKTSSGRYESIKNAIEGKGFPVILYSLDPSYNEILILPDDFERYNMTFPDSLHWIKQLYPPKHLHRYPLQTKKPYPREDKAFKYKGRALVIYQPA